jgi:hypothetical protein
LIFIREHLAARIARMNELVVEPHTNAVVRADREARLAGFLARNRGERVRDLAVFRVAQVDRIVPAIREAPFRGLSLRELLVRAVRGTRGGFTIQTVRRQIAIEWPENEPAAQVVSGAALPGLAHLVFQTGSGNRQAQARGQCREREVAQGHHIFPDCSTSTIMAAS